MATSNFDYNFPALVAELTADEGRRKLLYVDTMGNDSIGVGRNLSAVGLSNDEIDLMLANDIARATTGLASIAPWWRDLPPHLQRVMLNLTFNMGPTTLASFHDFLAAMHAGDIGRAVTELQNSRWWRQVGGRGPAIVRRMTREDSA